MLRQSLKSIPNLDKLCEQIGILPTQRAENISPKQFLALAELT